MAIHSSSRLTLLLILAHLIAALAVYLVALPLPFRLMMFLLVLFSLFWYLARDALLLLPDSWSKLSISEDDVSILRRDGAEVFGCLAAGCFASPYFVLLRVKPEGTHWVVTRILFPDALEYDVFRNLCVRLRFFRE